MIFLLGFRNFWQERPFLIFWLDDAQLPFSFISFIPAFMLGQVALGLQAVTFILSKKCT